MPLARTDIDPSVPVRREIALSIKVEGQGTRVRRLSTGIVPEDDVVNKTKAFLYYLATRKQYDRPETTQRIKLDLTRTAIVP